MNLVKITNTAAKIVMSPVRAIGLAVATAGIAMPNLVMAADLGDLKTNMQQTGDATGLSAEKELPEMIGSIINVALGLLGVIMVILMIYAGFLWMTAAGNKEKVETAKKILINAVIGAIILFAAYAIANFVIDSIMTGTGIQ